MDVLMSGLSPDHMQSFPLHAHSCWEIVVFLKGTGVHTVGQTPIPFQAGLIVCQPPNVPHGTVSEGTYQDMYIQVSDFVPPTADAVPVFQDDEGRRFTALLRLILESFHKKEPNRENIVLALYLAAYQLLVGWSARVDRQNGFIEALVHELVLNISNPDFDMARAIRHCGYCGDYVRRSFKKMTGQAPTAYLNTLRINQARRLLERADAQQMSIRQIAVLCGFTDPYYFSVLFKKQAGCSPSAYAARQAADGNTGRSR